MLGDNVPNENFYITSGHKVIINGQKMKARKVPGAIRIKVKPTMVYSICVDHESVIQINGMDVVAWGEQQWLDYSRNHNINWIDNKKISHQLITTN